MNLIDLLIKIDTTCFLFINQTLSNPLFDFIMPLFHQTKFFIPIILLPWIIAIFYDKSNRWKLAILIPILIILVDQTGVWIKKMVLRPRPWAAIELDLINHLVGPSGKNYSFPSNHSANSAALATLFSIIYYPARYLLWILALIIIFSRIYIGVHYPLDVIVGCFIGIGYGIFLNQIWERIIKPNTIKNYKD